MITYICLAVLFLCFAFIVLNKRIKIYWFIKGLMCVGMLTIIAASAAPKHHTTAMDLLLVIMTLLTVYGTQLFYKREYS